MISEVWVGIPTSGVARKLTLKFQVIEEADQRRYFLIRSGCLIVHSERKLGIKKGDLFPDHLLTLNNAAIQLLFNDF